MRLSPHFVLSEMTRSQTATRMGISNTPSDNEVDSLKALCRNVLEPVRTRYRVAFSPSSGYRSPALNSAIGGSSRSQHCKGEAVDFEIPHVSNWQVAKWIERNLIFDQLILEHYIDSDPNSGWIHVSYTRGKNRLEVLRFDGVKYRPGIGDESGHRYVRPDGGVGGSKKIDQVNSEITRTAVFSFANWIRDIVSRWSKK